MGMTSATGDYSDRSRSSLAPILVPVLVLSALGIAFLVFFSCSRRTKSQAFFSIVLGALQSACMFVASIVPGWFGDSSVGFGGFFDFGVKRSLPILGAARANADRLRYYEICRMARALAIPDDGMCTLADSFIAAFVVGMLGGLAGGAVGFISLISWFKLGSDRISERLDTIKSIIFFQFIALAFNVACFGIFVGAIKKAVSSDPMNLPFSLCFGLALGAITGGLINFINSSVLFSRAQGGYKQVQRPEPARV
eukprot:tig00021583_g22644.t1